MDFRIRQLQCFLTLSRLLNYGKTARELYMSQPTITFQIKSLEETFGAKLFERDRQQVRLTDAGVAFREYAQSIIDTAHAARERLADLQKDAVPEGSEPVSSGTGREPGQTPDARSSRLRVHRGTRAGFGPARAAS